jgi:uncharacterized protein involved in exopolysaccharide biosynthesis
MRPYIRVQEEAVPLPSPAMTLSSRLQTSLVLGGILFVAVTLTAMFLWMSWYTRRVVIADTYV